MKPSRSMRLHHFSSNSNLTAVFPYLMHSGLSQSCQPFPFLSLFWSYHLLVMTKLWLDLRMCSAFICVVHCLILLPHNPSQTATLTPPNIHNTIAVYLDSLTHYWRAEWLLGPHGNTARVYVCSVNVSPSLRLTWTWTHTKTQANFLYAKNVLSFNANNVPLRYKPVYELRGLTGAITTLWNT